jgi:serine/threonine protein kinase
MATVYEAFDPKLDMPVVNLGLPPQLALDPRFVLRFRREGRTLAQLTHPHIVRLYEIGENVQASLYYLVLEYLRGGTLTSRQGRAPWTVDQVVHVLRPVALAVDFAHHHDPSFVHRDLKPANIMFGNGDRVVVSDFGLARMLAPDDADELANMSTWGTLTAGAVLGTPAYMAPEQAEGRLPSEAADRYALGVIAFELLVGTVPGLSGLCTRNGYRADIYPWDRTVALEVQQDPKFSYLAPPQPAAVLTRDVSTYHIELSCVGPRISLAINDVPLVAAEDTTFSSGNHVIGADTPGKTIDVRLRKLVVTQR